MVIVDIKENCKFSIMFERKCVLVWDGLTMVLGDVRELRYEIDPFPHAWRLKFYSHPKEGDNGPWFDTTEAIAMEVEQAIEEAKAKAS